MYDGETWKLKNLEEMKLNTVQHKCLKKIIRIRWQNSTSNKTENDIANTRNIICEIKWIRWTLIEHK